MISLYEKPKENTFIFGSLIATAVHLVAESSSRAICIAPPLRFACSEGYLQEKKVIPLRNQRVGNLIENLVFKGKTLSVYYPETPRVPHHLTIALSWTLMSLYPNEKVSDEEMIRVRGEFGQMLEQKIEEMVSHQASA